MTGPQLLNGYLSEQYGQSYGMHTMSPRINASRLTNREWNRWTLSSCLACDRS